MNSFLHIGTLHTILLTAITIAATILAFITMTNALRLRNVLQSWKAGKLGGYPLFSSMFLAFSMFMTIMVWHHGLNQYESYMYCYLWIGLGWFISSHLMTKRYITDHGIVKNINDPSQTVSWHEIVDYAERTDKHGNQIYNFIYSDGTFRNRQAMKLDLVVPSGEMDGFVKILRQKLDRRFNPNFVIPENIEQIIKKQNN